MFQSSDISAFRITSWNIDHDTGIVELRYAFDSDSGERVETFVETIRLPPSSSLVPERRAALERCISLVHLVAGVSYFKAAAPRRVIVETKTMTSEVLTLLGRLYGEGLGEFAYVNSIPVPRPDFVAETAHGVPARPLGLDHVALVAVGGGKDSCVSIELLRRHGFGVLLASVNEPRPIQDVIEVSGLASVHATRTLSPRLFEINREGALNGHVPVTAIVSLTLTALAIISGSDTVVMSNERSASVGNLVHDDVSINHQFSKSFEIETLLSSIVSNSIATDMSYFSLLRPMSELAIAREFATTTRYDSVFTSCNRAFRIDESERVDRWCRDCPKCRFVFLALAPFTTPERLVAIFGANMLDDPTQLAGFDALIGWKADKPFECVGEVEESIAAFVLSTRDARWQHFVAVERFAADLLPDMLLPPDLLERPFVLGNEHHVPARYSKVFDATG